MIGWSEGPHQFRRGDFFTAVSPGKLGGGIAAIQKLRTIGLSSSFTHAGFFIDSETVFESLWRVQRSSVWDHARKQFLVGRWKGMTDEKFDQAWAEIQKLEGKLYPVPRLFMFMFTPIMVQLITPMKYIGLGAFSPLVCSELAGRFLNLAGFSVFDEYLGMMPARVANIIRRDRDVEIIHPKAPLRRLK
ncbi:hypothetical protein LCGC14_1411690 [marine sediment metagenome]|uniref:Uncharacterized protein n=1 Tax=marine sediment metagenome TaxID=412755 RepID=A0A0F9JU63_9ZZZZ